MTKARSNATAPAAKGEIVAGTGSELSGILSVGANGTVLTADSAEATGLKWAAPASGGMTLLSTTNLSGASVTVSSIANTYTNLFILCENYRTSVANYPLNFRFNSDTAGNYGYRNIFAGIYLDSTGESVAQYRGSLSDTKIEFFGRTLSTSSSNNAFATMSIYNYTSTSSKMYNGDFWSINESNQQYTGTVNGVYKGTSAISSITVFTDSTFNGGTIKIYGVK